jgi:adenylate cyclase
MAAARRPLHAVVRSFLGEVRRRKVWQAAAVYVVVALGVIEAADVVFPRLLLPDWTVTFIVAAVLLGLPLALALAWGYDGRRSGGEPGAQGGEPGAQLEPVGTAAVAGLSRGALPSIAAFPSAAAITGAVVSPKDHSIVVLPFENLSPGPDHEYFSDGLTDEIITDLSRLPSLRVISRTSAMLLKGSGKDARTIGRELSVHFLLGGSVRKAGERLRVTVQLVDTLTDAQVWAERYDGELGDVFSIQERVARSIADALRIELTPEQERVLAAPAVADGYAYDCVLRARHGIWAGTETSIRAAIAYLDAAHEVAGENVAILSAMGEAWFMLPHVTGEGMADLAGRLGQLAERILALDAACAAGHLNRGLSLIKRQWNFVAGLREFRHAAALDPTDTTILSFHSYFAAEAGCVEEGLDASERLLRLDPLSPVVRLNRAYVLMLAGEHDEAVSQAQRGFAMDPTSNYYRLFLMVVLVQAGNWDECRRLAAEVARQPADNWSRMMVLYEAALDGRLLDTMLAPELLDAARGDETFSWMLAQCLSRGGRPDEALSWLENAISYGFTNPEFLGERDVLLADLRAEPRFQELLARARAAAQALRSPTPPAAAAEITAS